MGQFIFAGREQEEPSPCERQRAAARLPAWLASMTVHLLVLLTLTMLTYREAAQARTEISLTSGVSEADELLDLAAAFEVETPSLSDLAAAVPMPVAQPSTVAAEFELQQTTVETGIPSAFAGLDNLGLLADPGGGIFGGGGGGDANLFGLGAGGSRFVYVFDRSGSMNTEYILDRGDGYQRKVTPLELAKTEMIRSLNQLADTCEFQIVFYNGSPLPFRVDPSAAEVRATDQGLFPSTDEVKTLAQGFVAAIEGGGSTEHVPALQVAVQMHPDAVFLITDGEAKDDPSYRQMRDMAEFCRRNKIHVNIIHFSDEERPKSTLVRLAEATGGKHRFLDLKAILRARQ